MNKHSSIACILLLLSSTYTHTADMQPAKPAVKLIEPNIGITKENRQETAKILNNLLSNLYVLYVKVQNYHWNVTGIMFHDLHLFFGGLYEQLSEMVDKVAERTRALGVFATGTLKEFTEKSQLKEEAETVPLALDMVKKLLNNYETIIRSIRTNLNENETIDVGTENMLSDLTEKLEKRAWMLRSYLS